MPMSGAVEYEVPQLGRYCKKWVLAISKLKLHKDDGDLGLASDYFVYSGPDLSTHVALLGLFTGIVIHGYVL